VKLLLVLSLILTAALLLVSYAVAAELTPNELGRIMILEYHKIDYPEERWTRTPENFRRDLETLYAKGYRLVNLGDLLDRRIALPAGTTVGVLYAQHAERKSLYVNDQRVPGALLAWRSGNRPAALCERRRQIVASGEERGREPEDDGGQTRGCDRGHEHAEVEGELPAAVDVALGQPGRHEREGPCREQDARSGTRECQQRALDHG